jgi:mRNA-degrading endonuclease YafQ of YafQ-DinJ toxin-antitoxin module
MELVWSSAFTRALKRRLRRQPELRGLIEKTLRQLAADPFHPLLHSHKLKGDLMGTWSCSVAYDLRIIFEFVENADTGEEELFLLTVGTHDEVY